VWGAQITAWVGKQVAVEVGAGYSPSASIAFATYYFPLTCTTTGESSTRLMVGSARLLVALSPPTVRHPVLYVSASVGVVSYSGLEFSARGTEWGPDLGVGVRMPLTATMAPRVELEDVVEPASPTGSNLILSVTLGGRRTSASDASGVTDP